MQTCYFLNDLLLFLSITRQHFLKKIVGRQFQGKGACVVRPLSWGVQSDCYIYYYTLVCGQCRAARQQRHRYHCRLVSQSVGGQQSAASRRRVQSRARRWSIVALVNK